MTDAEAAALRERVRDLKGQAKRLAAENRELRKQRNDAMADCERAMRQCDYLADELRRVRTRLEEVRAAKAGLLTGRACTN